MSLLSTLHSDLTTVTGTTCLATASQTDPERTEIKIKLLALTYIYKLYIYIYTHTGRFKMLSVITNIYNKKTKRPTLMGLFTAAGKLNNFF
jgi:hypothetical protein